MNDIRTVQGALTGTDKSLGIVVARFNSFICERLLEGALETLRQHGVTNSQLEVVRVPGAFEIPFAVKALARKGQHAGIVALGCVIRGSTPHFEYVAGSCTDGLGRLQLEYDVPVGFGVLTVDSVEQAVERAGSKAGNKGADAALSVLEMISLNKQLE